MNNENDEIIENFKFGPEIDLHHFHPGDKRAVVIEFINHAVRERLSEVRIIHGKGKSSVKKEVYKILESSPHVISYRDDRCNWGVTIAVIRY